jgi:hypothetical protein
MLKDLTVIYAPSQEALVLDVLTCLRKLRQRSELRSSMKIRFGWSVLTLRDDRDGGLIVCEPDFASHPLHEIRPQFGTTLDVLARQTHSPASSP